MKITVSELAGMCGGTVLSGPENAAFENITTASNKIKGSDLFIPIVGERTDGHLYIGSAFENGAAVSLTEKKDVAYRLEQYRNSKGLVLVDSTVGALQKFASEYRRKYLKIPFVGVTGSVGKTTTREMITAALKSGFKTYSTKGNANSQVGVPITVFETDPEAQIAVVELGISEFGEMPKISSICSVETAVMTNIGISHLAQFKTQDNILREKLHILSENGGDCMFLVNGDDPILKEQTEESIHALGIAVKRKISIRRYGTGKNCYYRAVNIRKKDGFPVFSLNVDGRETGIEAALSVPGDHMVMNALAALGVCDRYGLDLEKAARSLERFTGFEGRGNRIERDGYTIINDSYNASPASMKGGLTVLKEMKAGGRKIAVLADMKELGEAERDHHRDVGRFIVDSEIGLDELYTFGELASIIADEVEENGKTLVKRFTDIALLRKELEKDLQKGDILYLKGSWSMGLSRLI